MRANTVRLALLAMFMAVAGLGADGEWQSDSAIRGCGEYVEWEPVYKESAEACLSYCQSQGANACEYRNSPFSQCYVEFGYGCFTEEGYSGWNAAVIETTGYCGDGVCAADIEDPGSCAQDCPETWVQEPSNETEAEIWEDAANEYINSRQDGGESESDAELLLEIFYDYSLTDYNPSADRFEGSRKASLANTLATLTPRAATHALAGSAAILTTAHARVASVLGSLLRLPSCEARDAEIWRLGKRALGSIALSAGASLAALYFPPAAPALGYVISGSNWAAWWYSVRMFAQFDTPCQ